MINSVDKCGGCGFSIFTALCSFWVNGGVSWFPVFCTYCFLKPLYFWVIDGFASVLMFYSKFDQGFLYKLSSLYNAACFVQAYCKINGRFQSISYGYWLLVVDLDVQNSYLNLIVWVGGLTIIIFCWQPVFVLTCGLISLNNTVSVWRNYLEGKRRMV